MKAEQYVVTLTRPAGVSVAEMKAYIETAVASWAGGGDPDDPIFEIGQQRIKVTKARTCQT